MKLIASDLDGTLLLNGNTQVSDELFRLIDAYQKQGVLFCAASGRQYNSLRGLFAPVADDILYLCENGAVVFYKGKVLGKTCIPREDALSICRSILARPHCEVLISGEQTSYLLPKQDDYVDHIRYFVGNHVTLPKRRGRKRRSSWQCVERPPERGGLRPAMAGFHRSRKGRWTGDHSKSAFPSA